MNVIALSTVYSLCVLGIAGYLCWRAGEYAKRAELSANRLMQMRGRLIGVEGAVSTLDTRIRALNGKVARERRDDARPDNFPPTLPLQVPTDICDNWADAQVHGPMSPAARCDCAYCTAMRAARRTEKAAILATRQKPVAKGE